MNIIIAGGTGFLGKPLVERLLGNGHRVVILTRQSNKRSDHSSLVYAQWDGTTLGSWVSEIDGADAVINLVGESIADKRWSTHRKKELYDSRVTTTRIIVNAIGKSTTRPAVLINASAVGYYGNVNEGDVTESHPKGNSFLADLCCAWEEEAFRAKDHGVRVVLLRIGVVLDRNGGALKKMLPPFKMFVGGSLGSGQQWFPWIHRDDVLHIVLFALENSRLSGPVNVAAPDPVRMKEFCSSLAGSLHRPCWAPVPGFVLKLLLGEMSEMLLGSHRVIPAKLMESGFTFRHPRLFEALSDIITPQHRRE